PPAHPAARAASRPDQRTRPADPTPRAVAERDPDHDAKGPAPGRPQGSSPRRAGRRVTGRRSLVEDRGDVLVVDVRRVVPVEARVDDGLDVLAVDRGDGGADGLVADADGVLRDGTRHEAVAEDRKSTRLNSSHVKISYA